MDLVMLAALCALHSAALAAPLSCHNRLDAPAGAHAMPTPPRDPAERLDRWSPFIAEAARRFAIPEDWIRAVMRVESGGRTTLLGRPIMSPAGAMGLMQLMPGAYADMRRKYGLGGDPFDPHENILAGTAYLRAMLDRFGAGAFAAYNAGPARYRDYLDGARPLPSETVSYLAKLNPTAAARAFPSGGGPSTPSPGSLFVALSANDIGVANGPSPAKRIASPMPDTNAIFAMTSQNLADRSDSQRKNLFIALSRAAP